MQNSESIGCCQLSPDGTACTQLNGGDPSIELLDTNSCDLDAGTCNVRIRRSELRAVLALSGETGAGDSRSPGSGSADSGSDIRAADRPVLAGLGGERNINVPICSERQAGCLRSNCTAQVCGTYRYNPKPSPSFGDVSRIATDAGRTTRIATAQIEEGIQGLYGATCNLLLTDQRMDRFLENTRGSFVNTFRFGIGNTFDEFEKYRWMFPASDVFCNINPVILSGKDRYMNYLLTPSEFGRKAAGSSYDDPVEKVQGYNFCSVRATSPYLAPTYSGGEYPYYKMINVTRNEHAPADTVASRYPYLTLDKNFYKNFLPIIYRQEIDASLTAADGGVPAPFECTNGIECSSAQCNFFDYSRGICKLAGSGRWEQCSCNPPTRSCFGGAKLMDYGTEPVPATATGLMDAVGRYLDGSNFYVESSGIIRARLASVDPDCDLSVDGIDDINDYSDCIITTAGDRAVCGISTDAASGFAFTCEPRSGSNYECSGSEGERAHTIGPGISACTWDGDEGEMRCSLSLAYSVNDCIGFSGAGSSLQCNRDSHTGTYALSCNLGESSEDSPDIYGAGCTSTAGSDAFSGCSYNSAASTLSCTRSSTRTFNDCIDSGGRKLCGRDTDTAALERSSCDATLYPECAAFAAGAFTISIESASFPRDIRFFGEVRDGYVGYTLLPEVEFRRTDFYNACQPEYDVRDAAKIFESDYGEDESISAFWSSMAIRPPDINPHPPSGESVRYQAVGDVLFNSGVQRLDGGDCHILGDDLAHYIYVPQYIFIKTDGRSIGRCELDEVTNMPTAKLFGWCEGCSYATLAKQTVRAATADDAGLPLTKTESRRADGTGYSQTSQVCSFNGGLVTCPTSDSPATTRMPFYFVLFPDAIFMQEKERQYLQEGVMPVLDLSEVPLILGENPDLINRGPAIVIADRISRSDAESPARKDEVLSRLRARQRECDKCLLSVEVTNGDPETMSGAERMEEDLATIDALFRERGIDGSVDKSIFDLIDVVSYEFYPNEYTSGPGLFIAAGVMRTADIPMDMINAPDAFSLSRGSGASFTAIGGGPGIVGGDADRYPICSNPQAMNEYIFSNMENLSRGTLVPYRKLSLISDFSIDNSNSYCWGSTVLSGGRTIDKTQAFISYVFAQQKRLTKAGLMGIIYSDISKIESDRAAADGSLEYSDQFCPLQKGTRRLVADEPITIYSKVYTSRAVQCVPCTDVDISTGRCTTTCMNGVRCEEYSARDLPPGSSRSLLAYQKCPDRMLPEPCMQCSSRTGDLVCRRDYPSGMSDSATFAISSLNELAPDVIASIPYGEKCCLQDELGNYTFVKEMTSGKATAPIIFSSTGDLRDDCGVPDYSILTPEFCGQNHLPIVPYSMQCELGVPSDILPVIGGDATPVYEAIPRYRGR